MESPEAYNKALEKRRELQQAARDIGISEEYVSTLVDTFYGKVQVHPELGPVFNNVIQDRWPEHLSKMKTFWSTIALRTGRYQGNPMKVHVALTEAKPHHFSIWLKMFEETLEETAPNQQVVEYFMEYAHTMARRLSSAMFSCPGSLA